MRIASPQRMPRPAGALLGLIAVALVAVALAGCGNSRTPIPDVAGVSTPVGVQWAGDRQAGLALQVPSNWLMHSGRRPLTWTVSSGPAIMALWSYRRSGPVPSGSAALARVRQGLILAAKRRDPRLVLIRSNVGTIGGRPTVELDAFERVGTQTRRVRSTHVFTPTYEIVLDEYAPPRMFHAVDHAVFSPAKRSLRLTSA